MRQAVANHQHVNAILRHFRAERLAESLDGEFAGRIFAARGDAALAGDGRDIDDGRLLAAPQQRQASPRRFSQAEKVDFHDLAEPIRADLGEMAGGADPGVVNQDIEPSQMLDDGVYHPLAIVRAGDVGLDDLESTALPADAIAELVE